MQHKSCLLWVFSYMLLSSKYLIIWSSAIEPSSSMFNRHFAAIHRSSRFHLFVSSFTFCSLLKPAWKTLKLSASEKGNSNPNSSILLALLLQVISSNCDYLIYTFLNDITLTFFVVMIQVLLFVTHVLPFFSFFSGIGHLINIHSKKKSWTYT